MSRTSLHPPAMRPPCLRRAACGTSLAAPLAWGAAWGPAPQVGLGCLARAGPASCCTAFPSFAQERQAASLVGHTAWPGPTLAAGGNHSLRQSHESMLRTSQEAFKSLHASGAIPTGSLLAAGARADGVLAPMASATPGPLDTQQLRQSLSSFGRVVSHAGESSSNTSGGCEGGAAMLGLAVLA